MNPEGKVSETKGHDDKAAYSAPSVEVLSGQSTAGPNASLEADTTFFGEFS